MDLSRWALKAETLPSCAELVASYLPARQKSASDSLWWLASASGVAYVVMRYRANWPMTPMFAGYSLYPPLEGEPIERFLTCAGLTVVALAVCFPKDFYLPIIRTMAIEAHGALLFGAIARARFLVAVSSGANDGDACLNLGDLCAAIDRQQGVRQKAAA